MSTPKGAAQAHPPAKPSWWLCQGLLGAICYRPSAGSGSRAGSSQAVRKDPLTYGLQSQGPLGHEWTQPKGPEPQGLCPP